jgi:hypothetical protein
LAALAAPGKLLIAGGLGADGKPLGERALGEALAFTRKAYRLLGAEAKLTVRTGTAAADLVGLL